jgi:hypothetical protein
MARENNVTGFGGKKWQKKILQCHFDCFSRKSKRLKCFMERTTLEISGISFNDVQSMDK